MDEPRTAPDCLRCRHYHVTWEPDHPRGCRAYGFKSREAPSSVVLRESGRPCQLFEPRPATEGERERS